MTKDTYPHTSYLSLIDSFNLKCISILIIVLHNYIHWTNNIGENEMELYKTRIFSLFEHITSTPIGSVNYLISYFGWYFITPFIFISGYGLSIKLQKNNLPIFSVILQALFKTMILLMIGTFYIYLTGYMSLNDSIDLFIKKLSTIDNLFKHTVFSGIGPWWYFSLVIQLYILFPFVLKSIEKYGIAIILPLSYIVIYFFYYFTKQFNVFGTAIGHLPELIMGIALAKNQIKLKTKTKIAIIFLLIIIFILSNRYAIFFPLTYSSFLVLFLILFFTYKDKIHNKFFCFIGMISPFIFLINGPIRQYTMSIKPFLQESFSKSYYEILVLITSITHLLAVIMIATLLFVISKKAMDIANKQFDRIITKI